MEIRNITREEMKALCIKAYDGAMTAIDRGAMQEQKALFLDALQGTSNYISTCINPIEGKETPFLILALRIFLKALEKQDPIAGMVADEMGMLFGSRAQVVDMSSVMADAMRAMHGEGSNG